MKTIYSAVVLIFIFIFCSMAQTKIWERGIGPATAGQFFFRSEIRDFAVASDGKIYSTGYFRGNQAKFGNLMVYADSGLTQARRTSTGIETESSFIACQSANGDFLWVKSMVSNFSTNSISTPDFLGVNLGTNISIGPDNSIYTTGSIVGDSIRFENSVVQSGTQLGSQYLYLLKLSPTGSLVWAKMFDAGMYGVLPRFLQNVGQELEMVASHYGSLQLGTTPIGNPGVVKIRFDQQGNIINYLPYSFSSSVIGVGFTENVLTRKLPDGKWVIGHFNPVPVFKGFFLSILNPDFSLISTLKIEMNSALSDSQFIWPMEIVPLPQGNIGIVAGFGLVGSIGDEYLIVGNDTLSVGDLTNPLNGARTLFIKLANYNCMKQVEGMKYYLSGSNAVSQNGNIFSIGITNDFTGIDSTRFKQYNRNGELISSLNLGKIGHVGYTNFSIQGLITPQYTSKVVNQDLYISHGQNIFKLQVQDNAVIDQSFNGCLSNRALALASEEAISGKKYSFVAKTDRGFSFHSTRTTSSKYKLLNSQGLLIENGEIVGGQKEINAGNLASGVYVLQVAGEDGLQSFKLLK